MSGLKKTGRIENLTNAGRGRPPGVTNKVTREIRDAARALVEDRDYVVSLRRRLQAGKAPHMETLLFHYAYGKPKEQVEVSGPNGTPIRQIIHQYMTESNAGAH